MTQGKTVLGPALAFVAILAAQSLSGCTAPSEEWKANMPSRHGGLPALELVPDDVPAWAYYGGVFRMEKNPGPAPPDLFDEHHVPEKLYGEVHALAVNTTRPALVLVAWMPTAVSAEAWVDEEDRCGAATAKWVYGHGRLIWTLETGIQDVDVLAGIDEAVRSLAAGNGLEEHCRPHQLGQAGASADAPA